MAEKLRLGREVRELKIGQSFTNQKSGAFHAVRYDFKPASVDINKIATLDVANNNQVTVTVPHLDGAGVPQTVFKGSQRPFTKECVLIIDKRTGEITLEKLTSNMQVKKTRTETLKPQLVQQERNGTLLSTTNRSQTPPNVAGQRQSNKTRVTSGGRRADRPITHMVPKHSPLHASPNYPSPTGSGGQHTNHHKSPKRPLDPSSLPSLPMIGVDDFSDLKSEDYNAPCSDSESTTTMHNVHNVNNDNIKVQEMSDDSSSSSSSSDSEDSGRGSPLKVKTNGSPIGAMSGGGNVGGGVGNNIVGGSHNGSNHGVGGAGAAGGGGGTPNSSGGGGGSSGGGGSLSKLSMPTNALLSEDLCLSESGSDSDD